jgi:hypothetical protein
MEAYCEAPTELCNTALWGYTAYLALISDLRVAIYSYM